MAEWTVSTLLYKAEIRKCGYKARELYKVLLSWRFSAQSSSYISSSRSVQLSRRASRCRLLHIVTLFPPVDSQIHLSEFRLLRLKHTGWDEFFIEDNKLRWRIKTHRSYLMPKVLQAAARTFLTGCPPRVLNWAVSFWGPIIVISNRGSGWAAKIFDLTMTDSIND